MYRLIALLGCALAPAVVAAQPAAEISARDIGSKIIFIGDFGRPVGEIITIEGETVIPPKGDSKEFLVRKVNGKELRRTVLVQGINHWPEGQVATIQGHEVAEVTFRRKGEGSFPANDPRDIDRQTVNLESVALRVLEPKGLTLARKP